MATSTRRWSQRISTYSDGEGTPTEIPTTLHIYIPPDVPYASILRQTEVVYDQLLAERRRKLQLRIDDRRQMLDDKSGELLQGDPIKAAEFQRWAQAALAKLETQCADEMTTVREDYEDKFEKLKRELEEQYAGTYDKSTIV